MEFRANTNFAAASARFEERTKQRLQKITRNALNNQAFAAREAVQAEIKRVFRDPEPATIKSVMVRKVQEDAPINAMWAEVYIADDLPKGSVQPAKYLATEEAGGIRSDKRGERALTTAGILPKGMQMTPGPGMPLDAHGQPLGGAVVSMLSRLKALSNQGYSANATDATRKKIRRQAMAAAGKAARLAGEDAAGVRAARAGTFIPLHKTTGTDFFLMKSRLYDGPGAIFRLVGRGRVIPVAWFASKRPTYSPRFLFKQVVARSAKASWQASLARAMTFVKGNSEGGSK